MIKTLSEMTDEEIAEHLAQIRLRRKTGYERKTKARRGKKDPIYDLLRGVNVDVIEKILRDLQKEEEDDNEE